jgi:receptor tyrosine kinase-like orphan receptor 1
MCIHVHTCLHMYVIVQEMQSYVLYTLGSHYVCVITDEVCYTGNGQSYRGIAHMTSSRNKCTPWSHQFHVKTSDYPELVGHSFCRNPGELEDKPWCYTEDNQREKCDVPKCGR